MVQLHMCSTFSIGAKTWDKTAQRTRSTMRRNDRLILSPEMTINRWCEMCDASGPCCCDVEGIFLGRINSIRGRIKWGGKLWEAVSWTERYFNLWGLIRRRKKISNSSLLLFKHTVKPVWNYLTNRGWFVTFWPLLLATWRNDLIVGCEVVL